MGGRRVEVGAIGANWTFLLADAVSLENSSVPSPSSVCFPPIICTTPTHYKEENILDRRLFFLIELVEKSNTKVVSTVTKL